MAWIANPKFVCSNHTGLSMIIERFKTFTADKCWQAQVAEQNLQEDLKNSGISNHESLSIDDFEFRYIDREDVDECRSVKEFIERHEWLGKLPIFVTHRFGAYYNGELAGVVAMATPNAFSNLLGEEYKKKEKLISRGASISWAPKNLASWLIMKSIRWMVHNTEFKYFTAYSDPEAKELGTIYQACNFIYLGNKFGSTKQYLDPDNTARGWFGSSGFSDRSQIIRYAKKLGIEWSGDWIKFVGNGTIRKIKWDAMPDEVRKRIKDERKDHMNRCESRSVPSKHKYCYILGENKKETKKLKSLFEINNPDKVNLLYPKERGR